MDQPGAGYFAEDATGIFRQSHGELCPALAIEWPFGIQVVGAVENPSYHVPLGQAE